MPRKRAAGDVGAAAPRRRSRAAAHGLACAALALAGLGADPGAPAADCLERPAVSRYLHHIEDQVMGTWVLPEDLPANHEVLVKLRFAADGRLLGYRIVSTTSRRLAKSVELALSNTGPFAPLPADARCLVGRTILTTFRNPA